MTDQKETPKEMVAKVSVKLPDFWTEDPDLWFLHAEAAFRNAQTVENQIRPHRTEASPEDYGLGLDHGFRGLLGNPLRGFKGQACFLVYSISLAEGFQTNSPPWIGRLTPYRSHGHHVSPPT